MNDDRIVVLANVRDALARRREERTPLPDWDESMVVARPAKDFGSLVEQFQFKFEAAGGLFLSGWSALHDYVQAQGFKCGYVDPTVHGYVSSWPEITRTEFDRGIVDSYEFSVTRATAGIAESGTLLLTESGSSSRIGALAPWVHVALLKESDLLGTIPEALRRMGQDRAALFVTGPSKTADVEGILIKGVHGPGIQVCCLVQ
jgi:L-lactate dehydrogenase complex protein LldG